MACRRGMIGGEKTLRIHEGIVCIAHQSRERDTAAFTLEARSCAVEKDAEDPCLQRGARFEPIEALQDTEPCFLNDFLGNRAIVYGEHGDPDHGGMILRDERHKGDFIAATQFADQARVIGGCPGERNACDSSQLQNTHLSIPCTIRI